jgi:CO/xanthine dehydrogenase FAD-binding subunit
VCALAVIAPLYATCYDRALMKLWNNYHLAQSVEDALHVLTTAAGDAQIVAGGTDLLLDIQQGNHAPIQTLVDVTRIPELTEIAIEGDTVIIGAGVTHSRIEAHPIIAARATCLIESCGVVGGPQVRNVATIGGNVVHALPAADGTLSLVALGAQAEIATIEGRRWLPITELFLGAGQSLVDPSAHLLTRFRVPLSGARQASAFQRIMRPQGVALPILGCAVWVELDESGAQFADASICIGPVQPTPMLATDVQHLLIGKPATPETINAVANAARDLMRPRTSKYRATSDYRIEMIEVLLRESLTTAVARA